MEDKIIELIKEKESRTSLGIPMISLANLLNLELPELKELLRKMYKEGKIKVNQGINDKIIKSK